MWPGLTTYLLLPRTVLRVYNAYRPILSYYTIRKMNSHAHFFFFPELGISQPFIVRFRHSLQHCDGHLRYILLCDMGRRILS